MYKLSVETKSQTGRYRPSRIPDVDAGRGDARPQCMSIVMTEAEMRAGPADTWIHTCQPKMRWPIPIDEARLERNRSGTCAAAS